LIGTDVGVNAYGLRTTAAPWHLSGIKVTKADQTRPSYSTQKQFQIDGDRDEIFPTLIRDHLPLSALDAKTKPLPSLLPPHDYSQAAARWAMVIDATACIGCNACVLSCQVENNVPVVGPDEIARNRDMHWLRIDAYDLGEADGRMGFQPVPCMHCETAPCEPVCPVGASVHDSEGLNVQVYNRCVGTRFCEANCPYKVRRFNFFGYADGQEYQNLGAEVMHAHNNPNVTVRARGVMEKCTYCVQRISGARRAAEKEGGPIRDGDVTTACQNACPTQAIAFGNLNDAQATVSHLQHEPQHFTLLGKLNTKPRTTYLADVRNPNPALSEHQG
jgi:molybdopterin-containing oxidoreductase family iron-sulfur binding subunit